MLTIQDLLTATQPVSKTDIGELLEHLGYSNYQTDGTCDFWSMGKAMPLTLPLDSFYAKHEGDDMFPPDYVQGLAAALLRHQRIQAKGGQAPAR